MAETPPREGSSRRGPHLWTLIVSAFVGAMIAFGVDHGGSAALDALRGSPPPIKDQIDGLVNNATKRQNLTRHWFGHLKGPEHRAMVFVEFDRHILTGHVGGRSDRLTVYDIVDDDGNQPELRQALSFKPQPWKWAGLAWNFEFKEIRDVNGDGTDEVLGIFRTRNGDRPLRLAVMVRWDPLKHRYKLNTLLRNKPRLRKPTNGAVEADWETYRQVGILEDPVARIKIRGYTARQFQVVAPQGQPVVQTAFSSDATANGLRLEIKQFSLPEFDSPDYRTAQFQCGHHIFKTVAFDEVLRPSALAKAWDQADDPYC